MNENDHKLIVLEGLEGNPPTILTPLQKFLESHIIEITVFWWLVWTAVLVFLLSRYIFTCILRNLKSAYKL